MIEIIPAILVKSKEEVLEKIMAVEPYVERVHLDVADGIFVPNMTFDDPDELMTIETNLKIGIHLMVSKPENHVVRWLESQADRFFFHIEATQKPLEVINMVKDGDREIGIALNPDTPVSTIEPFIDLFDFVHFMTVEPGFYGGEFVESVLEKIKDFHFFYPDKPIQVDGGVDPDTVPKLIAVGATRLVAGSYIFESEDLEKSIGELRKAAV